MDHDRGLESNSNLLKFGQLTTQPQQQNFQVQQTPSIGQTDIVKMQETGPLNGDQLDPSNNHEVDSATSGESQDLCSIFLTAISLILVLVTFPISLFFCIKVVEEYESVVIFRLGRLLKGGARGPGIVFIIPCIETYHKIDMRNTSFRLPAQEVWLEGSTRGFVVEVHYRVSNATKAFLSVKDYDQATRLAAIKTFRGICWGKKKSDILSEPKTFDLMFLSSLNKVTDEWGVTVDRVAKQFLLQYYVS